MLTPGTWWLQSSLDPRWNATDKALVGGFVMPEECQARLTQLEQQYGPRPIDLVFGYEKD